MSWGELEGHENVRTSLQQSLKRGRLSHAYLLSGTPGVGKRLFARNVAQALLCQRTAPDELSFCGECPACQQVTAATHPDLVVVELPAGRKFLPIAAFVGDEQERGKAGLCYSLALRPVSGQRRVAIIDDADRMNQESANALLKTLEEPPNSAVIMLIAGDASALLPTIRSRCQTLHFHPLADSEMSEVITRVAPDADEESRSQAVQLAEGSVATALELLDPELRQLSDTLRTAFAQPDHFNSVKTAESLIKQIDALARDSAESRHLASWMLRFLVEQFRQSLRATMAGSRKEPLDPRRTDQLSVMIERCLAAQDQLDGSMPVPLCLEGLFDEFRHLLSGTVRV